MFVGRHGLADVAAIVLMLAAIPARAGFDEAPFELRLFLAVDRQSNYSSTLARQASIAALEGGSANPGAVAFRERSEPTTTVTATLVEAPATGGRSGFATPDSLRWQGPGQGTIALAYAYTDTRNGGGDNGFVHALRSDEWIAGDGRRLGEQVAAGVTIRLTSGTIVNDTFAPALADLPIRNRTTFLSPDVSVGIAAEPTPSTSVGLSGGYGRAQARSTVTNLAPLTIPVMPGIIVNVPAGAVLEHPDDVISTFALRAGGGYRPDAATGIYVDLVGVRLSTDHSGSENIGRMALGVERRAGDAWMFRSGVGIDTIGAVNWSAGFGYRPSPGFEVDVAFQTNAAPELNRDLGHTRLLAASLAWTL
jgi:hypothetical protein